MPLAGCDCEHTHQLYLFSKLMVNLSTQLSILKMCQANSNIETVATARHRRQTSTSAVPVCLFILPRFATKHDVRTQTHHIHGTKIMSNAYVMILASCCWTTHRTSQEWHHSEWPFVSKVDISILLCLFIFLFPIQKPKLTHHRIKI